MSGNDIDVESMISIESVPPERSLSAPKFMEFSLAFCFATLGGLILIVIFTALADPYDTGRFSLFSRRPLETISIRMSLASLGRDAKFNAAIIGNSHVAPISPHRLSAMTGLEFVALPAAGSGPTTQTEILRWFLSHRRDTKAIVIGIDDAWCEPKLEAPFPRWLMAESPIDYATNLVRFDAVEQAIQRVIAPEKRPARSQDPRGYWDIAMDNVWFADAASRPMWIPPKPQKAYPSFSLLSKAMQTVPDAKLVLFITPVWRGESPSPDMLSEQECAHHIRRFAASRPNTTVVDGRANRLSTRDPRNFFDTTHYRDPLAIEFEREIGAQIGAK